MIYTSPNVVALEIKALLDDLGTLGTIQIGGIAASPDELGAINEYGGFAAEARFGVRGVGYENPTIQLVFRGAPHDYETPMTRARNAWQLLASVLPGTISTGTSEYLTIKPMQSPFSLGQDLNQRYTIVCNYLIRKEP